MNILIVEDDKSLNNGIALSFFVRQDSTGLQHLGSS